MEFVHKYIIYKVDGPRPYSIMKAEIKMKKINKSNTK